MHKVKCSVCGEYFDRDKIDFVLISPRKYVHKTCNYQKEKTKDEIDLEELESYIKKIYNNKNINPIIRKQIKDFREEYNFTYSGIRKTLIYLYEINKKPIEQNTGIALVPYYYDKAMKYYYNIYLTEKNNKEKLKDYFIKTTKVRIKSPTVEQNIILFDLDKEGTSNE